MAPITLNIYPNLDAPLPIQVLSLEWKDLAADLIVHEHVAKKDDVPLWNVAKIRDGFSREDENVQSLDLAVFDLDHVSPESVGNVLTMLQAAGLAYIIYSTFSHNPDKDEYCFRLILRPDRPVLKAEWRTLWAQLRYELALPCDPVCLNEGRVYYSPSCPPERAHLAMAETGGTLPFSVDAFLNRSKTNPPPKKGGEPKQDSAAKAAPHPNFGPSAPPKRKGPAAPTSALDAFKILSKLRKPNSVEIVKRLQNGEPLAKHPHHPDAEKWGAGRDGALNTAVSIVVAKLPLDTSDDVIKEIFAASLSAMGPNPDDANDVLTVDNLMFKVARARERIAQRDAEQAARDQGISRAIREQAAMAAGVDPDDESGEPKQPKWTEEEIEGYAAAMGWDEATFVHNLIVIKSPSYFVFDENKVGYRKPIKIDELPYALHNDLRRAPIQFYWTDEKGKRRKAKVADILDRHAVVARNMVSSLTAQKSYYDVATETFYEAVCPLRPLEPVYHKEINDWLTLLGGDESDKFLDWIATLTDLNRMSCAVYIKGDPGVGKGLLSAGLARLWHIGTPTDVKMVVANFNDAICNCPLVVADEKLPDKGKDCVTLGDLRSVIGTATRPLSRKFMPNSTLQGSVRLLITANNDHLLGHDNEDLTPEDLEAISVRFLYIEAPDTAAKYLVDLGGFNNVNRWITEDMIAQHALWLRDNRKVTVGNRFAVEGRQRSFHNALVVKTNRSATLCEWFATYIMRGLPKGKAALPNGQDKLIRIGNGKIEVASALLSPQNMTKYTNNAKPQTTDSIGRTLATLAVKDSQKEDNRRWVVLDGRKSRIRFHQINPELVLSWAKAMGVGDPNIIESAINQPIPDDNDEENAPVSETTGKVIDLFKNAKPKEGTT